MMPGVPKSLACNNCRRQKKKCDLIKPICTRCKSGNLRCDGNGQQRYIFVSEAASPAGRSVLAASPAFSEPERLAGTLVTRLHMSEVNHNLTCFGGILQLIPRRLGTSKALDTATDLFNACFATRLQHQFRQTPAYMAKNGAALGALRETLADPRLRGSPETMCAVYIHMLSNSVIHTPPNFYYARGLVAMLQSGVYLGWRTQFGLEILRIALTTVLMEVVSNLAVQLDSWLPELLDQLEPRAKLGPSRAHESEFGGLRGMAQAAIALREPLGNYDTLVYSYVQAQGHWVRIRIGLASRRMEAANDTSKDNTTRYRNLRIWMLHYSQLVTIMLAMNKMLQLFDPADESLARTADVLVQDMIEVGDAVIPDRPMGSLHALPGLSVAWAVTNLGEKRAYISRQLFQLYDGGFPLGNPMRSAHWWVHKFAYTWRQICLSRMLEWPDTAHGSFRCLDEEIALQTCHVQ